jgi:hypothetical protein
MPKFAIPNAAMVLVLLGAACSTDRASTGSTPSEPTTSVVAVQLTTSTTTPPEVTEVTEVTVNIELAPLTGRETQVERAALVIKIDNHDRARPQFGLNQADVVFEEIVEGGITRLAAVFHSEDADPVGPVRSARTGDFDLLTNLDRPLFANSGGNQRVLALLRDVDMVDVGVNAAPDQYWRLQERSAPHNLLTTTEGLFSADSGRAGQPSALFSYRTPDDALPASAEITMGVSIDFGENAVSYEWNAVSEGWARTQNGELHVDADDWLVAPANVVVQFVNYGRSAASSASPEAQLVGDGAVWVFTSGRFIKGTWSRSAPEEVTLFVDIDGDEILLTPGRTWVELPRVGQAALLVDDS